MKQHPKTWVGPNSRHGRPGAGSGGEIDALTDTLPPSQIKRLRDQLARREAATSGGGPRRRRPDDLFAVQCRN